MVDYNRQSLDAVVREGLWERFESIFRNFGWDVVLIKYGTLQQAAFADPAEKSCASGSMHVRTGLFGLDLSGRCGRRKRLTDDLGDRGPVSKLIERHNNDELAALMANLGGHDGNVARCF